jgi:hypothetical protein
VLVGIAAFPTIRFHKFFLGEDLKGNRFEQVWFYILMTVLVASVFIFVVAEVSSWSRDIFEGTEVSRAWVPIAQIPLVAV